MGELPLLKLDYGRNWHATSILGFPIELTTDSDGVLMGNSSYVLPYCDLQPPTLWLQFLRLVYCMSCRSSLMSVNDYPFYVYNNAPLLLLFCCAALSFNFRMGVLSRVRHDVAPYVFERSPLPLLCNQRSVVIRLP